MCTADVSNQKSRAQVPAAQRQQRKVGHMARAKPRSNPARTTKDQQGARGRLTTNAARQPILTPRVSKAPAQDSDFLTTAQGQRLAQTDDSLKVGSRGPTLMDDFHLREKITHFDHERIP